MKREELIKYKKILVTGVQRSGTHFISLIAAKETGYLRIVEMDFSVSEIDILKKYLTFENIVIQCPAIVERINELDLSDVLVVWVERDNEDIIASQKKMWTNADEFSEREKYLNTKYYDFSKTLIEIKKDYFNGEIKNKIPNLITVNYNDFLKHELSYK